MRDGLHRVNEKLSSFKKKYYLNLFVRGAMLTLSLAVCYFLIAAILEYNLWLSGWVRFFIFLSFFLLVIFSIYRFLKKPIAWWVYKKGLGQEESAAMIGSFFPEIHDRLLNVIQLSLNNQPTALLEAGIDQKSRQFEHIPFDGAIDLGDNKRYLKYLLIPLSLVLILFILNRSIFTQSTQRIIQFNTEFSPEAPFKFKIQNKDLNGFFNEDFTLNVVLDGDALPEAMYLVTNGHRLKLEPVKAGVFAYTFEKIQNEIPFQLEASGFYSDAHKIALVNRPELTQMKLLLQFPRYLNKKQEQLVNSGNLEVPEGTKVTWQITTSGTNKAFMEFSSEQHPIEMQQIDNQLFTYGKGFANPERYGIGLQNEHSNNKDKISYSILVLKDQFPQIKVDHMKDSVLYKSVYLGGLAEDDYGVTELNLCYQLVKSSGTTHKKIKMPIRGNSTQQNFFLQWRVDSLELKPGDKLNYYLEVWDNDGVNGRKSTRSQSFEFALPGVEELKANIAKSQSAAESKIDESLTRAKNIREAMEEAQQKLKGKQTLDWQDKKMLEDLVQQKNGLDKMINELQKQNELLEQKKDAFSEQNEKIREKAEQIQKLMNELLDPETKKLFEELEKLLKENADLNQVQKMLDKMNRKEINLEKELERTLELFKQLQLDYKVEQAINEIKEQKEKQQELLKKTEELVNKEEVKAKDGQKDNNNKEGEKSTEDKKQGVIKPGDEKNKSDQKESNTGEKSVQKSDNQELAKEQEKLSEEFKQVEKTVQELSKLREELKESGDSPSQQDVDQVKESQKESKESLDQGDPKKSAAPQKKSVKQMQEMQEQLEQMQSSMEMEMDMDNLESLRQIVHGLIKLSFDQEALMKEFGPIQQTDPKYIQLSQNQLKVKDDAKVLEDSLLVLAKKDAFMGSVITKEVGELNSHLDKAAENIRERRKSFAGNEMQLSMTSINNLAVMLNDHYDMMMEMMANAKPGMGKKGKQKQPQKSLGELQQQLNMKIDQLKKGGKQGREYSEEVAQMAAEQERIRRALQEMQERLKKEGGKAPGNDLPGKMEQTEMDLVNKQITEQTIQRQKDIVVRLLEAEKSMREQDLDEERKGETAKDYEKEIPGAFEDYLRLKEKEVELLKTVPPKLYPYYKKEVNDYFKRIGNHN